MGAANADKAGIARILVKNRADAIARDNEGETALIYAVEA